MSKNKNKVENQRKEVNRLLDVFISEGYGSINAIAVKMEVNPRKLLNLHNRITKESGELTDFHYTFIFEVLAYLKGKQSKKDFKFNHKNHPIE